MGEHLFGYGMSTVVEIKGPTDTFATLWAVKMLNFFELSWRSWKLSETAAGTGANNAGGSARTHTIQTNRRQRPDEMDCPTRSMAHSSFPRQ